MKRVWCSRCGFLRLRVEVRQARTLIRSLWEDLPRHKRAQGIRRDEPNLSSTDRSSEPQTKQAPTLDSAAAPTANTAPNS